VSKKKRMISFGVFIGVFLLAYSVGVSYKMSDEEAKTFLGEFQSQTEGIDAIGIFSHNASVALVMFVPAFGIAWGSYTAWSTGAAFSTIISSDPTLSNISPLSLLATPFGTLELVAYSIGMSRSFLLIVGIVKRNSLKKMIKPTLIEIGIAIVILLIAGFIEYSMVSQQHV
jgi:uncharacterized membrane protein SpoIIM required for sporulation